MSYKLNASVSTNTTFTGTISLPSTTSIGNVSSTEIGYVDGVTSAIQTQLNGKQPSDADLTAIAALAGTSGYLKKTAADTWTLDTSTFLTGNQSITLSGDVTGSGTTTITTTLANTTVSAGSYGGAASVGTFTVDAKGRLTAAGSTSIALAGSAITSGTVSATYIDSAIARLASPSFTGTPAAPTPLTADSSNTIATTAYVKANISALINAAPAALDTLDELAAALGDDASFASTVTTALGNKQPLDGDLTAIAALAGTTGWLKKTAADTWALDTTGPGNQTITLSGDVTGSGATAITTTLANTAVSANSYGSATNVATFTVDSKGRLTAAGNTAIALAGSAITSGTVSATYIDSAIARLASPSFTGTVTTQGEKKAYVGKAALYTLTTTDNIVNATTGTWAATLPTAVGVAGQEYTVKNSGTGVITVGTTSSQTIDGSATQSLAQYESVTVISDGANWIIV